MKSVLMGCVGVFLLVFWASVGAEPVVRKQGRAPDAPWVIEERKSNASDVSRSSVRVDTAKGKVTGGVWVAPPVKTFNAPLTSRPRRREHRFMKTEKFSDGRIRLECHMVEIREGSVLQVGATPDGSFVEYYRGGPVFKRGRYSLGKPDGKWTEYLEGGKKRWEATYCAAALDGLWTEWYPSGQELRSGQYTGGAKEGVWIEWHPSGVQASQGTYVRGKRHGVFTFWKETGALAGEVSYSNGVPLKPEMSVSANSEGSRAAGASRVATGLEAAVTPRDGTPSVPGVGFWRVRLKDQRADFRVQAVTELGNLRPDSGEAAKMLGETLFDPDSNVSKAAADALARMGVRAAPAVPAVTRLLMDHRSRVPNGLSKVLRNCGSLASAAAVPCIDGIKKGRIGEDQDAADFLADAGAHAVQYLVSQLRQETDPAALVRLMHLSGRMGPHGRTLTPALAQVLRGSSSDFVRWQTAEAMCSLGFAAGSAAESLAFALDDRSGLVRASAARALGSVGPVSASVIERLERTLLDPDQKVKLAAAETLGRIKATSGK